jgi:signal transduction histidine kinase
VRQVLLNLVANAIKFGRGKPVQVVYTPHGTDAVEVAVIDQGPGIAEADLPRIFEEFVQLGDRTEVEGTGLGLPICRRLTTLLNGSLTATSKKGEGSTFRVVFPSMPAPGAAQHGATQPPSTHTALAIG